MRAEPAARAWSTTAFRGFAALIVLLCMLSVARSWQLIFRAYHDIFYWDQWLITWLFERALQGTMTLQDLLALHSEHRILFPRLVFLLDLLLTGARNGVNFIAIILLQAIQAALFFRMILGRVERPLGWTLMALVVLLLFGAVQSENFEWGFQVQFFAVFLFLSISAYSLASAQARMDKGVSARLPTGVGLFFGAGAALTMSNGAVALLCVALAFVAARRLNRLTAAVALIGVMVLVAYAATLTPNPGHTPPGLALRHPAVLAEYTATYLGSQFRPLGFHFALCAGLAGLGASALAGFALATGRIAPDRANLTLVAIIAFIVASAAITALGRSSFGPEQALASRYATASGIFWAALLTLAIARIAPAQRAARTTRARAALVLLGLTAAVVLASNAVWHGDYRNVARQRAVAFERATNALLSSVDDTVSIGAVFSPVAMLNEHVLPILRRYRLNIFARPQLWPLGAEVPEARLVADSAQCLGAVDRVEAVRDTAGFRLIGWGWSTVERRPFRRLLVLSQDHRVAGFGSSGERRDDLRTVVPAVTDLFVGWAAYARAGGALTIYGQRQDGALCRIGAIHAP